MTYSYYEAFAGIGAWGVALSRVVQRHNDLCQLLGYWDNDQYASNAYAAVHEVNEQLNMRDISKKQPELSPADIFFYSPPCQPFSIGGKQEGTMSYKGTLFWYALQHIKETMPKFAIMENVKGLADKHRADLEVMLADLEASGYVNYAKVLSALDYGVAQNRDRLFVVSIRKDLYDSGVRFEWPVGQKLTKCLGDYLDREVDESYYIDHTKYPAIIKGFMGMDVVPGEVNQVPGNMYPESGNPQAGRVYHTNGVSPALTTMEGGNRQPKVIIRTNNSAGEEYADPGDSINLENVKSSTRRGRIGKQRAQTLNTAPSQVYFDGNRLRRFTPIECWRLQGFDDEHYYRAVAAYDKKYRAGQSNAQMYIRAGNSIPVPIIEEILENLLYQRKEAGTQLTLF